MQIVGLQGHHIWLTALRRRHEGQASVLAGPQGCDHDEGSLYTLEGGGYGFPSVAVKAAAVDACTSISGVTKVAARQAFRVVGEPMLIRGAHPGLVMRADMVRINGGEPQMREDMVRVGMGTADLRYRAQFWPWSMTFHVGFNGNVLSAEQVLNLLNVAGFAVGIGDWRSQRDGVYGAFHVALEGELALEEAA